MEEPRVYKLYLQPEIKVAIVLVFLALAGIGVTIIVLPWSLQAPKTPPPLVGMLFLVVIGVYLYWFLCLPHRIILAPDGTLEFISLLRRWRVRAEEIRSIKPRGSQFGFFVVRTESAKIRLLAQFDGFHDFLTRLEALHPAVELRGC